MSDDFVAYKGVGKEFLCGHFPVIHKAREYAFMDRHSNTAEGFFSILKRGVIGTYHHWSPAHLHRYLSGLLRSQPKYFVTPPEFGGEA